MIRSCLSTFILLFFLATSVTAQNVSYPIGLSVKNLFLDYQSSNGGDISNFSAYDQGFEISVQRAINDKVSIVLPFRYGVIGIPELDRTVYHRNIYSLDLQAQYSFYNTDRKLSPYAIAGLGGVIEDEGEFNMQIPLGIGVNFKIANNAYVNWQSEFRFSLKDDRNNFQHGLGFTFYFGEKKGMDDDIDDKEEMKEKEKDDEMLQDSDGDGLEDDIDLCPQLYGPKELKGCPDNDDDGIPDYRDDCPSIKGLAIFKGCPDTDQDGIPDNDDVCPNLPGVQANGGCPSDDADQDGVSDDKDDCPDEKGLPENNGCPELAVNDTDSDGVPDDMDNCPDEAGTKESGGCPDSDGDGIADKDDKCPESAGLRPMNGCPDSDGDGIDDSRDKCPNTKGTVDANGCPGIAESDLTVLETAMRAVQFDTGKATLKPTSYPVLNQIANIMERYPDYNLVIEGHTDNVGNAASNQVLSENRAKACYEYLVRKGITPERMSYRGYGEAQPIANNNSLTGRELNRRVEFNLKPM